MVDQLNCAHPIEVFKPMVYKPVYNGSFHVAVPNNPQEVLTGAYGDDWETPDSGHKKHGNTKCQSGNIQFTKQAKESCEKRCATEECKDVDQ